MEKKIDSVYCNLITELISEKDFQKYSKLSLFNKGLNIPMLGGAAATFNINEILNNQMMSDSTLIEYMDIMLDSMPENFSEEKNNMKARYRKLLKNSKFSLIEEYTSVSIDELLTVYLPQKIASIFCYTYLYDDYDKQTFSYIDDYIHNEFKEIYQTNKKINNYTEMILILTNRCVENEIFTVCQKATIRIKLDKERMKTELRYINLIVFNSMYQEAKNSYDTEVSLPQYNEDDFEKEVVILFPDNFFKNTIKHIRPNTLCQKLREADTEYVENEVRKAQYITFSKLTAEMEDTLNADPENNEIVVKETIMNRITTLMDFTGYTKRSIPKSMKSVFFKVYKMFNKDFINRIKLYNEKGCIDYTSDVHTNEILKIVNKDSEAKAISELCKLMKVICLINCTSADEYMEMIDNMKINENHIRAVCRYYQTLTE